VSDFSKYYPRLSYTDKVFTICTKESFGPISGNLTADASTIGEFGGVILAVVNESQLGLVESGAWLKGLEYQSALKKSYRGRVLDIIKTAKIAGWNMS
jgi:hypothetical protein